MHNQEYDFDTENEPKHLLLLTGEDFFGFEGEIIKSPEKDMVQLQQSTNQEDDSVSRVNLSLRSLNDVDNT